MRDGKHDRIYAYNDQYMRYFVQKSIKAGRCAALSHYSESIFSDEVLSNISTEQNFKCNVTESLDNFFEFRK